MILHVTFSTWLAGQVRQAVQRRGLNDQVIGLEDCLSFGPINPADPLRRQRWLAAQLGHTEWQAEHRRFWQVALAKRPRHTIAWLYRRDAGEYAGFLEFIHRLGNRPCEIIDATDSLVFHTETQARRPLDNELVERDLFSQAHPLDAANRRDWQERWQHLRSENAVLRILDENLELVSVPLSHFDSQIMALATDRFRKGAYIVGKIMSVEWDKAPYRSQVWDIILAARLQTLVEAGQLECTGDPLAIRYSEVRLPAK
ncbi:MAG TPA: DUF3658 domain-containing protein [Stellaceae bacterium]|jgi:hypothetical protein|nr:DUF3658 domain-containing protein [Stellaceae bacterium]